MAPAKPLRVQKREAQRQQTMADRKAEAAASAAPAAAPPAPVLAPPQTLLGLGRGLLSWSQCPVPLTAVVNRERDEHGQTQDWVLVTTAERFTADQIRSTYELRPAIEERHRQYKCFWDLTRMHSCAFSLASFCRETGGDQLIETWSIGRLPLASIPTQNKSPNATIVFCAR